MTSKTSLLSLPPELVTLILSNAPPTCHLDFAVANKHCFAVSKDILAHHKRCHEQYSLISDILPMTVPRLVRALLYDPIAAWHVHRIEFWGQRSQWESWQLYHFRPLFTQNTWDDEKNYVSVDLSQPGLSGKFYRPAELEAYKGILRELLGPHDDRVDAWIHRLINGDDEPLRVMLLACAPRLTSVRFATCGERGMYTTPYPLPGLTGIVGRDIEIPYFRRLSHVAVCLEPGVITGDTARGYGYAFVTACFRLPALESIYIRAPRWAQNFGPRELDIAPRSSTVKHIWIQEGDLVTWQLQEMVAGAIALKSYCQTTGGFIGSPNLHNITKTLHEYHADTLESLNLCARGAEQDELARLYHLRPPEPSLAAFNNLIHVTLNPISVLMHITKVKLVQRPQPDGDIWTKSDEDIEPAKSVHFAAMLPGSIRSITLASLVYNQKISSELANMLDHAVSENMHSRTLPHLSAFFIRALEPEDWDETLRHQHRAGLATEGTAPWFQRSVAAGHDTGVEVYTTWTHTKETMKRKRHELGIPRRLTTQDLETDVSRDVDGYRMRAAEAAREAERMTTRLLAA